jgi:hypothetical protein
MMFLSDDPVGFLQGRSCFDNSFTREIVFIRVVQVI